MRVKPDAHSCMHQTIQQRLYAVVSLVELSNRTSRINDSIFTKCLAYVTKYRWKKIRRFASQNATLFRVCANQSHKGQNPLYQCRHSKSKVKAKVKADIALHGNPISELRDVTCRMGSHSITCHPTQVNAPRLTPAMQAGTRFTNPGGMEGWVDIVDLIAPRLEVEPATFRSRVRRRTAAPPRQPSVTSYMWQLSRSKFSQNPLHQFLRLFPVASP